VILITHFLGRNKTGLLLTGILSLSQIPDLNQNQINFPIENIQTDNTITLVKSHETGQTDRHLKNYETGRRQFFSTVMRENRQGIGSDPGGGGGSSASSGSGSNSGTDPGSASGVNPADLNNDGSLSNKPLDVNQVPPRPNWKTDMEDWTKDPNDEEEGVCEDGPVNEIFGVPCEFDYQLDENGNPILFVPNLDSTSKTMKNRKFNRVDYDQTASHMHHAPDHGIQLPADFDMRAYEQKDKAGKIEYAKEKLTKKDIIAYQNKLAQSMSLKFNQKTLALRGSAGIRQADVGLVFQKISNPNKNKSIMMTIINDTGQHVTSYPISQDQLKEIQARDFWVIPDQPFN
jgi:hypothetical protein